MLGAACRCAASLTCSPSCSCRGRTSQLTATTSRQCSALAAPAWWTFRPLRTPSGPPMSCPACCAQPTRARWFGGSWRRSHLIASNGKLAIGCGIAAGKLCDKCQHGRCVDKPGPGNTVTLEDFDCLACGGGDARLGCDACDGTGRLTLKACPQQMLTSRTRDALRMARFARDGFLPRAGGWRDQTARDVALLDFARSQIDAMSVPDL